MSQAKANATESQKKSEPARQSEQGHGREGEQAFGQSVTWQAAYRRARVNPATLRSADLLALQRTVGNRGVQGMLARRADSANGPQSQSSPNVSQPGDLAECEAEAVASALVVGRPFATPREASATIARDSGKPFIPAPAAGVTPPSPKLPPPSPAPTPIPVNLSTTGADAFEPGIVSVADVQKDPKWVENDIVGDQLSDKAPWTHTLTYKDNSKLVIPLEQVFMERLPTATVTIFRKQKGSGRIVPCVLSQSDPRLKALKGPAGTEASALADLATPRFDSQTAPKIVSLVNAAQMLFLGKGMLEVLQVQAMNPLMGGGMGAAGKGGGEAAAKAGAGAAAKELSGAAAKEGLTFVEIGAGNLKASIELAKKGGVKVIAVDPVAPAGAAGAAAVKELQGLGGQFVKGVAADLGPSTADHVFQYFPWKITGTGSFVEGGTWRLVEDTVRLLKPNGAAHFVTEEFATAEFLAKEASKRGLRAVITETTAGAAAPGASGAGVPAFSKALKVWLVNIYK